MKVLFGSFRYDPTDPDGGSGSDHAFYRLFCRYGIYPKVVHPHPPYESIVERAFVRVYKKMSGMNYAKFRLSTTRWLSAKLNESELDYDPDLIFTMWPNFLVFHKGAAPCVYRLDTCLYGQQLEYPTYGNLAMRITEWEEQRAFIAAKLIITHSVWSKDIIADRYSVQPDRIHVFPIPSSLPTHVIPDCNDVWKEKHIERPIRLLLVGREYHRKGVDIAVEVAAILNRSGLPTVLTVCGLQMSSELPYVHFVGPYKKGDPAQLQHYIGLYARAHLLIHPARFEAAGIAPAEAAAFGTPTITNSVGGLATSVADGVSGIVLPKRSPAELYAQKIIELMNAPERYYQLCQSTRQRYERELNWDVAGKKLLEIFQQVAEEYRADR